MISAAKRSVIHLGDASTSVADFVISRQGEDGGFVGRSSQSDLYYTLFALESLIALGAEFDEGRVGDYLTQFGVGKSLDFVHLACLVRCLSNVQTEVDTNKMLRIIEQIEGYRTEDGGYSVTAGAVSGSAYACFLALGAYENAKMEMPNADGIVNCIGTLRKPDGSFANEAKAVVGVTPATAAAIVTLGQLGQQIDEETIVWLMGRVSGCNGFEATPSAPIGDLLSTATALFAMECASVPVDEIREGCLDFLDSVWDAKGGFKGSVFDDALDCEYTYYGLLALGVLS